MNNNNRSRLPGLLGGLIVLVMILSACASPALMGEGESGFVPASAEISEEMRQERDLSARNSGLASYDEVQTTERLVIQDASLVIVVDDPSSTLDEIAILAEDMGGYVVSANLFQTETGDGIQVMEGTITVRVPAEELNAALETIKGYSDQDPLNENISSQDVTSEYVDLQSRLRNLEAAETKLIGIMNDANRTEDVLAVYNELVEVQGEIEITKGRINYLEQSAALSSITTQLVADEAVQPLSIGGWEPVGVVKSAIQALINALKFLVNAGIWVIIFVLPIVLILFVVVFLPIRWLVRRLRRSGSKAVEPPPDSEMTEGQKG